MSRTTKRFIYQIARWQIATTNTLQELYQNALRQATVAQRDQPVSDDATETTGTWRRLTYQFSEQGVSLGKLAQFTHGMTQETIHLARRPGTPPEGNVQAPEGDEFSDGSLYFCIDGNHVVVAQSQSLRIAQLESYLNWFLKERTQIVARENFISLESIAAAEARQILAQAVPDSVTFSRPVEMERTRNGVRTLTTDATVNAIQELLGVNDVRELLPPDALEAGRLKTQITLSWNSRVGGMRPVDALQGFGRVALRAIDEDPTIDATIVVGKNVLSRRHLSLAETKAFTLVDGAAPVREIFDAMHRYLVTLRQQRQVVD